MRLWAWNNGQSIINIDDISRMVVTRGGYGSMDFYRVYMKFGTEHNLTGEEYSKLAQVMIDHCDELYGMARQG